MTVESLLTPMAERVLVVGADSAAIIARSVLGGAGARWVWSGRSWSALGPKRGVERDGLGVELVVDQVEVGVEHGEQLLPDGIHASRVAGRIGGPHEHPVQPLVIGAGQQPAASGPVGLPVITEIQVAQARRSATSAITVSISVRCTTAHS